MSSFKNLLQHFNQDPDKSFTWYKLRKIYLFYDAVNLVKNIQNNSERFIFPSFKFDDFKDLFNVPGGMEIFHDIHGKDTVLEANLRKASQLTVKVIHPANCKQNVPAAVAVFHETTVAIQSNFPDESSTVELLNLFRKWWVISNSKSTFSTSNYLGNIAVNIDQKLSFLRAMSELVQIWQTERIHNCRKLMVTAKTGLALLRTLL